jgi:glycosyltransferase involved in cell wall biosynthesis
MRILMLSDYETQGGAAVSASRLAEALAEQHDVLRCVLQPDGHVHPWQTHSLGKNGFFTRQFFRIARRFLPASWYRPACKRIALHRLKMALQRFRPHVINVHNIHGGAERGWGPELVDLCAAHAPTVWALHDMWSFTGRCAYAYDCRAFETGCTRLCPTKHEYPALDEDKIAPSWEQRRDLCQRHANLRAVVPSRWLAAEAARGLWKLRRVDTIPYGLPLEIFRPIDRVEARRRLGLPLKGLIALIAAQSLTERRKGGDIVPHIWLHVRSRPLTLALMGEGRFLVSGGGIDVHALGWVGDPHKQALVYSAADVLVHPAPVDNLPNVVLEAIACGTPVAAFPIGGVPDMVRPGVSGWLAPALTPQALAATLDRAFQEIQEGTTLRQSCRDLARREYALSIQAQRYEALFQEMCTTRRAAA